jgi:hypothetical protein
LPDHAWKSCGALQDVALPADMEHPHFEYMPGCTAIGMTPQVNRVPAFVAGEDRPLAISDMLGQSGTEVLLLQLLESFLIMR